MRESKFYLFLGLGVLAFSIIWTLLVFLQIEGDIGEYANTPRTIPFFLGVCMGVLGLVFLYQYRQGYVPKNQSKPLMANEIRNIGICIFLFISYSFLLKYFGYFITRFLLSEKNWKLNYVFPIAITGLLYFLFIILLKSTLPRGQIF
jgi:hypothetical protein